MFKFLVRQSGSLKLGLKKQLPSRPVVFRRNMRLVSFVHDGKEKIGVEVADGGDIVDVGAFDNNLPSNMRAFLAGGKSNLEAAQRAVDSKQHILPKSSVLLRAPVTNPGKIIGVGMNYTDHCLEQNAPIPKKPVIFNKFVSALQDPFGPIILPTEGKNIDWEVELAIIIGKKGSHIEESEAMDYVAGFAVAHDVGARDLQFNFNNDQWILSKSFDTFCPVGPAIVTKDSIPDPHNLGIRCRVNGTTMQDSNTTNMIFKTPHLVSYVSRFCTLAPGDIMITGTPPGVGVFRKPPIFLKAGDIVECEIDGIGCIRNEVKAFTSKY